MELKEKILKGLDETIKSLYPCEMDNVLKMIYNDIKRLQVIPKPDWNLAPEWAMWLAQDQDGIWNWYEVKPVTDNGEWMNVKSSNGDIEIADSSKIYEGWQDTLEIRSPEYTKPKLLPCPICTSTEVNADSQIQFKFCSVKCSICGCTASYHSWMHSRK